MDPAFGPHFEISGKVNALALQSDGKVLVGGMFNRVGASSASGLVRLTPEGQRDPTFVPEIRGDVTALAIQPADGKILVAGEFQDRTRRLVRLNSNGSVDSTFLTNIWAEYRINALVVDPAGMILVGGQFGYIETEAGTVMTRGIARLLPNGQPDTDFYPFAGYGPDNQQSVDALALAPDGRIYVGGQFDSFNEISRANLVRLRSDGSLDRSFETFRGPDGRVMQIALRTDGTLWVAGEFSSINLISRHGVALLNADGSVDPRFRPEIPFGSGCSALLPLASGELIVAAAGYAGIALTQPFMRLSRGGKLLEIFEVDFPNDSIASRVTAMLAHPEGTILFGGIFQTSGHQERVALGEMRASGIVSDRFSTPLWSHGSVREIEVQSDGKTIVTGLFSSIDGVRISTLARLNLDGSIDTSYRPMVTGSIWAMTVQPDDKLLIGGYLVRFGGLETMGVARLNPDGTPDFFLETASLVRAILVDSQGRILICTQGPAFDGPRSSSVTRLLRNGSLDSSFVSDPTAYGSSFAIAEQSDGKLIVGGNFRAPSGVNYLARLRSDGLADLTFQPPTSLDSIVTSLAVDSEDRILVGGWFLTWAGTEQSGLGRLQADGSLDPTFKPALGRFSQVERIIVQKDGKILTTGQILPIVERPWSGIARLNTDGTEDVSFDLEKPSSSYVGYDVAEQPNGGVLMARWTFGSFMDAPPLVRYSDASSRSLILGPPTFSRDGRFEFKVMLPEGSPKRLTVEASEDLRQWTPFQSVVSGDELELLISAPAVETSGKYFRATLTDD